MKIPANITLLHLPPYSPELNAVENLWDKYAVSGRSLESQRAEALKRLNGFLEGLGYSA